MARASSRTPQPAARRASGVAELFRIATETRQFAANDLSGKGAALDPGRWNKAGECMIYAATSISLATLETAAHIDPAGLPLNRFLIRISVPSAVWRRRETLDVRTLGPTWNAVPAGLVSEQAGSAWLRSRRSLLLLVPSVIVPEECCVLVNPAHADIERLRAAVKRPAVYERLFRNAP